MSYFNRYVPLCHNCHTMSSWAGVARGVRESVRATPAVLDLVVVAGDEPHDDKGEDGEDHQDHRPLHPLRRVHGNSFFLPLGQNSNPIRLGRQAWYGLGAPTQLR